LCRATYVKVDWDYVNSMRKEHSFISAVQFLQACLDEMKEMLAAGFIRTNARKLHVNLETPSDLRGSIVDTFYATVVECFSSLEKVIVKNDYGAHRLTYAPAFNKAVSSHPTLKSYKLMTVDDVAGLTAELAKRTVPMESFFVTVEGLAALQYISEIIQNNCHSLVYLDVNVANFELEDKWAGEPSGVAFSKALLLCKHLYHFRIITPSLCRDPSIFPTILENNHKTLTNLGINGSANELVQILPSIANCQSLKVWDMYDNVSTSEDADRIGLEPAVLKLVLSLRALTNIDVFAGLNNAFTERTLVAILDHAIQTRFRLNYIKIYARATLVVRRKMMEVFRKAMEMGKDRILFVSLWEHDGFKLASWEALKRSMLTKK
jgi:hypothetical protein